MNERVLLTGGSGFTGRALAEALRRSGYEVLALSAHGIAGPDEHVCDLADAAKLQALVHRLQPQRVIHLAAISFVASQDQLGLYRTNVLGTCNLLECLASAAQRPSQVILASSGNVYGVPASAEPLSEDAPLSPVNHYACSKLAMEHMARSYADRLPITIVRPFNYSGPGQSPSFLLPKIVNHFARRAALIELGNVDVSRDFASITDVVSAYIALIERRVIGQTLNICTGRSTSIKDIIEYLVELTGHRPEIRSSTSLVRASEIRFLAGENARLRQLTGWQVTQSIEALLEEMLAAAGTSEVR